MAVWMRFTTAGDDRVCPGCKFFEGMVAPVELTVGVIPLHPFCRCEWVVVGVSEEPPGPPVPWITFVPLPPDDDEDDEGLSPFERIAREVRRLHDEALARHRHENR